MAYSNFYARFYAALDKSKASLGAIFHLKSSRFYLIFLAVWQLIVWLQAWFINKNLSGDILVLHYNVDFGIDLVGDPARIYLYPLLGLGIFVANFVILAILYKDKNFKILAHFLLGAAALFGLFLSIALLAVYLINFR
jgi:hypothetical protein